MPIKTVHNSPQLREWLRRDNRTIDHAAKSEFAFPTDIFAKAVAQKSSHHPHMSTEQLEMRAAHLLLLEGHSGQAIEQKLRSHFSQRVFWEIVFAVVVIFLLLAIATRGHAQNRTGGIVIQLQNQGSNLGAPIGGGLVTLNASTNVTLARTGTTSLFTITATGGGGGSGCTPPGTTLNAILTDLTGGACGAATKWTASTTTLTGLATGILDMSAAARLRLPQITAPTNEGDAAFNTTTHLPVWGFNNASTTTIAKTLANASHKWLNSYDQTTGTLTQTQPDYADLTGTPTLAQSLTSATHKWLNSYDASTGLFTQTQPDYGDLTGVPSTFAPSAHNLLSASHGDTVAASPVRGDILIANSTPAWTKLALGAATSGKYAKSNGTDVVISSGSASGTGTPTACSNQVVTALTLNADAAPTSTCTTITTAFLPGSGATTVNGQTCTLGSTCTIPLSAVNPETATYQVLAADFSNYKTITVASGTFTITLVASGSQPAAGQYIQIINYGSGVVTVARSGQNINGAAGNFTLSAGSATAPTSAYVISDATNYFASIDEGTVGTVTSVGTSAPLGGGTITTTGTLTCTTCATTTNGGALSGTSPVAISAGGLISCATCATTTNGGALSGTSPVTVSVAGAIGCATCTVTIANGTSAMGTGAISSATCATVVTTSATGTATTDNIMADFNADPHAVTGYVPSTSGMLTIIKYPTANNVNFLVCNNTSGSITPGAITLNWRVVR